jgi:ATP-binding cassette, subfamily F, member 2
MSSKWHEKKNRLAEIQFERDLLNAPDDTTTNIITDGAMGKGDEKVFERKMTKEEKKAAAKAKREAKRKAKGKGGDTDDGDDDDDDDKLNANELLQAVNDLDGDKGTEDDGIDHEAADALAAAGTICTFSASRKGVDARSRDINVQNFTLQHMGTVMLGTFCSIVYTY